MEEFLKSLMFEYHQYAYIVLFIWCILEGELGLIFAGIMCHAGLMSIVPAILVGGAGAFVGDHFYFYIGRYNKRFILKFFEKQKRKFAVAHLMLNNYGAIIIFLQRYMYGFRIIIPMSIGLTRYDSKKYAFFNLISGYIWAGSAIVISWYFGEEIWEFVGWAEKHWYLAIPIVLVFIGLIFYGTKSIENRILNQRKERKKSAISNIKSKFRRNQS